MKQSFRRDKEETMKRRKKAAGKIVSSVLCSALAVSMAVTPVVAAPGLENQSTEGEADSVSERFLLNYQTVELNLADSFDLPLYLTTGYYTEPSGNGKITWTSSNPEVAAVSAEGRVHAVSEGTATITAVHADYPGREAVCEVTV